MKDNGAHSFTEAANYTTEEQFGTVPKEIKKENIYLDLSKLSEEERKEVYFLFPKECFNAVKITLYHQYLHFDTTVAKDWFTSLFNHDKTEISLSQFKELFQTSAENAQVENNGWIKIESELELPNDNEPMWVMIEDCELPELVQPDREADDFYGSDGVIYHSHHITHYQPIVKPEPPKF